MIESIMYFGIGFLLATLVAVALIPSVHSRAVRLDQSAAGTFHSAVNG